MEGIRGIHELRRDQRMGGSRWEEIFFFLCLSKVLAQYQLAKHLRNDHELIIWPHKNRSPLESTLELPAKQNKNCISVSSDPQLYRNTHFDKGQKSMKQQKM